MNGTRAGVANVRLLPGIADSLAGRMELLTLWPLSSAELTNSPVLNRAETLFHGGPETTPRWADQNLRTQGKPQACGRIARA